MFEGVSRPLYDRYSWEYIQNNPIYNTNSSDASWYFANKCNCTTGHWCDQHRYILEKYQGRTAV